MLDWGSAARRIKGRSANLIRRYFPERQILLKEERRVRCLTITTRHQLFVFAGLTACAVWSIAVTCGYVQRTSESEFKQREIADRTAEVDGLKKNYQAAFGRLDEFESLFSGITCEISDIQDSLLRISEKAVVAEKHSPMPRLDKDAAGCRAAARMLPATADATQIEPAPISTGKISLGQLASIGKTTVASPSSEGGPTYGLSFDADNFRVDQGVAEAESPYRVTSDSSAIDPGRLRQRVSQLGQELDRLRASHNAFLQYSVNLTEQRIGKLEKTLASVGMGGRHAGGPFGQGGPFIAVTPGEQRPSSEDFDPVALFNAHADRYDNLNGVLHSLPLATPMDDFEITSPFGTRNDPINTMTGIHEGVDLGAAFGTRVVATGNGTVVWAGWHDRYGLLVEIDHGSGLQSRYAHLSKALVKVGDHVNRGTTVGLVGETGRTTGPHLHYEVRVDDHPVNPMKFISAGEHVLKDQ